MVMAKNGGRVPPMLAGGVDLAAIREPQTPGTIGIEVVIRYALNCYQDVNDALPFLGVIDTESQSGPPAISLINEKGENTFYVLAPNTIATLQQFLGVTALQEAQTVAASILRDVLEAGPSDELWVEQDVRAKLEEALLLVTDGIQSDEQGHDDPSS